MEVRINRKRSNSRQGGSFGEKGVNGKRKIKRGGRKEFRDREEKPEEKGRRESVHGRVGGFFG